MEYFAASASSGLRVCMCVEKKDCQGRVIEWPGLGWAELEPLPGPGGVRRGMTGGSGVECGLVDGAG